MPDSARPNIVVFISDDHTLRDSSVYGAPGTRTATMVSLVDVLPTLVDVAGGNTPAQLDRRSFENVLLGRTNEFRYCIFATHSGDGNMNVYPSRCVRDARWKYILNLHPEFKFTSHITETVGSDCDYWHSWVNRAKTDAAAATLVRRYQERPREELYDLMSDPLEHTTWRALLPVGRPWPKCASYWAIGCGSRTTNTRFTAHQGC